MSIVASNPIGGCAVPKTRMFAGWTIATAPPWKGRTLGGVGWTSSVGLALIRRLSSSRPSRDSGWIEARRVVGRDLSAIGDRLSGEGDHLPAVVVHVRPAGPC